MNVKELMVQNKNDLLTACFLLPRGFAILFFAMKRLTPAKEENEI